MKVKKQKEGKRHLLLQYSSNKTSQIYFSCMTEIHKESTDDVLGHRRQSKTIQCFYFLLETTYTVELLPSSLFLFTQSYKCPRDKTSSSGDSALQATGKERQQTTTPHTPRPNIVGVYFCLAHQKVPHSNILVDDDTFRCGIALTGLYNVAGFIH